MARATWLEKHGDIMKRHLLAAAAFGATPAMAATGADLQARDYARMAGFAGVRLLAVEETLQQGGPMAFDVARPESVQVTSAKLTPIEPGRVGTVVQLTAKYEMTR